MKKLEIFHNKKGGKEGGRGEGGREESLFYVPAKGQPTKFGPSSAYLAGKIWSNDLLHVACSSCLSSCAAILISRPHGNALPLGRVPQRRMELTVIMEGAWKGREAQRRRLLHVLWFWGPPACLFSCSFTACPTSFLPCDLYPHTGSTACLISLKPSL